MTDSDLQAMALRFQVRADWLGFARVVEARARAEALRDLQEYKGRAFDVRNGTMPAQVGAPLRRGRRVSA